tara:strand:- start:265 stop:489 length:225 start_codon:yes stop_codon:yes gene_type:complete
MKNLTSPLKKKLIAKYNFNDVSRPTNKKIDSKSTDINVLLNRVKLDRKNEIKKKFFFSAAASTGLLLFGLIVFS